MVDVNLEDGEAPKAVVHGLEGGMGMAAVFWSEGWRGMHRIADWTHTHKNLMMALGLL